MMKLKNTDRKYWFEVGNILNMSSIDDVLDYVDKKIFYIRHILMSKVRMLEIYLQNYKK